MLVCAGHACAEDPLVDGKPSETETAVCCEALPCQVGTLQAGIPPLCSLYSKEAHLNHGFNAAIEKKIRGHPTEKLSENCQNLYL